MGYNFPTYTLTAEPGVWNNADSVSRQWLFKGTPTGNTTLEFTVPDDAQATDEVKYVETAINTEGSAMADAAVGIEIPYAPTNIVPPHLTYTPPTAIGVVITCDHGEWDALPQIPVEGYSYNWKRNNVSIGAPDQSTYVLQALDDLKAITCTVTATNLLGSDVADTDNQVDVEYLPVNNVPIVIGISHLTASVVQGPSWVHAAGGSTLQWYKNGVLQSGQTSTVYGGTATFGDILMVRSTATNVTKVSTSDSADSTYGFGFEDEAGMVYGVSGAYNVTYTYDFDPDDAAMVYQAGGVLGQTRLQDLDEDAAMVYTVSGTLV